MEQLYVFGTGNAAVTHCYNTCFAIRDGEEYFMVDGKYEGTLAIYCHGELIDTIKTLCRLTIQKKFCSLFDDRIHFVKVTDGCTKNILGHEVTFFDILSTKAKQFGFVFRLNDGRKLVCAGDEPVNPDRFTYLKDAHWLLTEAFCLYGDRDRFKPYEKHHSTVKDAAVLAEANCVPNLVLWHTEDKTLSTRKELYTAEGQACYHGRLFVPEDGEIIELG